MIYVANPGIYVVFRRICAGNFRLGVGFSMIYAANPGIYVAFCTICAGNFRLGVAFSMIYVRSICVKNHRTGTAFLLSIFKNLFRGILFWSEGVAKLSSGW